MSIDFGHLLRDPAAVVILGPMGSGKTTLLLQAARQVQEGGRQPKVIKPLADTRDQPAEIRTHDGKTIAAQAVKTLSSLQAGPEEIFLIDEHHFFDAADWSNFAHKCASAGASIVTAGLEYDFYTHYLTFPTINVFMQHSFDILHLRGPLCERCGKTPSILNAPKRAATTRVGGFDLYSAFCRPCGFKLLYERQADYQAYTDAVQRGQEPTGPVPSAP